jgi:ribonuclease D
VDRFAFDTESNSMHAYTERVCLLQVSLPDGEDAVIDPLAVDPTPLGGPLGDPAIVTVMHGADYDVLCLRRQYGIGIAGLFDTNVAARVLGWDKRGLGPILAERFDFVADKKMQRFDWGRRPLPPQAIAYARHDTHWLLALRAEQLQVLGAEPDRLDVFEHACRRQEMVQPRPTTAGPDPWRIKGFAKLPADVQAIAAALVEVREAIAEQLDRPLFKVMADEVLLALAREAPSDRGQLRKHRRMHPRLRGPDAPRLLAAIARGREDDPPPPPQGDRPAVDIQKRFDALRGWRKTTAQAEALEPDLVLSKAALWVLAETDPVDPTALASVDALDDWERARYGEAVLACLSRERRPR